MKLGGFQTQSFCVLIGLHSPFSISALCTHRVLLSTHTAPLSAAVHIPFPNFIFYLYLVVLGLCCCAGLLSCSRPFPSCSAWLLIVVASYCRGQALGLQQAFSIRGLAVAPCRFSSCSSWALGHRLKFVAQICLSCSTACGIFLDQGSNLSPAPGRQTFHHRAMREVLLIKLLPMWLASTSSNFLLSPRSGWIQVPQSPTPNHLVGLSGAASPHPESSYQHKPSGAQARGPP